MPANRACQCAHCTIRVFLRSGSRSVLFGSVACASLICHPAPLLFVILSEAKDPHLLRQFPDIPDGAFRRLRHSESVGGVDKWNTGQPGCLLVLAGISDIYRLPVAVPFHHKADVFPLHQPGAFPFLIVGEKVPDA